MPGRNTTKIYVEDAYYHLYNRGHSKAPIFNEASDYVYFEWLMARTLSQAPIKDRKGREYTWLRGHISLHAYCLMSNHFHIFGSQKKIDGISKLMSAICTAYTLYFNKKYKRRGPLFENTYRAVMIDDHAQLMHITRYIHLNHSTFRSWPHSSFGDYVTSPREWVDTAPILDLFDNQEQYAQFVAEYEYSQRQNEILKQELADHL